ncbi:MAG TPA: Tex family protein [Bacteroidales bacterium]|nr:Tex family protein [Bacteroidales bacterium]HOH22302.1 Tex family protein [Bacteroidales bacterium]HPZ03235.1 Tex family protein [Bacteroidales bacterium]HQB74618.1 Tex family protein [Bacteroidales bacterium]
MNNHYQLIANELKIKYDQVKNSLDLLNSGATVPFISRYRKEATGSLDEVMITQIRDLYQKWVELDKRRAAIIDSITEQGKMTPQLQAQLEASTTLSQLEDIYLPYRPKRKTRATVAIDKGLEPLAKLIFKQQFIDLKKTAQSYINQSKEVNNIEEALQGARDIIAEWISEDINVRSTLREKFVRNSTIYSRVIKGKEDAGSKFEIYFKSEEPLWKAPSHRVLAMLRGEEEGFLKITIKPQDELALNLIQKFTVKGNNSCSQQVILAGEDSYKRLLQPQMETEMRRFYKEKADKEAIRVFGTNLRQLLMSAPLGQKTTLAIDPGFRTGCKVVVLDRQGQLLDHDTIFPHPPHNEYQKSSDLLKKWVHQYQVEAIAIGNGTAGRETENFVRMIPFNHPVTIVMVDESGASIYSASETARKEFPDLDLTVRGAISIGRRLMDPLAELVKIDPKSLGVGQYQHDVNQTWLQNSLQEVVESCVNNVGVEINSSSTELLSYVSGIGPNLANNIIEYRNENGPFQSRDDFHKIPRFGPKTFEQAAGFLRIHGAENPLDYSAVHPESYEIVEAMASHLNSSVQELMAQETLQKQIKIEQFVTEKVGIPTLKDIMKELAKPGRDPREAFEQFEFDPNINSIQDLVIGMVLPGIVTNITNFGCFVDVGVHQDGLVHVSQMANRYVSNPNDVVKLRDQVLVKVVDVDLERKRISLSMKDLS